MNLTTNYLGLDLECPLVLSASPVTRKISNICRLQEAGFGAIVMHSIFEEEINEEGRMLDEILSEGTDSFGEATSYIPEYMVAPASVDHYLNHLEAAVAATELPVIASLNGSTKGGWIEYANKIEQTGVKALELNLYHVPADPDIDGATIERNYLELVRSVCETTSLPVAVKISPFLSAPANFCRELSVAGAKGVVLFNRFYQPDIDLEKLEVTPNLKFSHSEELRLPMRWTALLSGRIPADIALTGGVHNGNDLIKSLLCGATVAMMTSEVLMHGLGRAAEILDELRNWMAENDYQSVDQLRGAMRSDHIGDPSVYERANYLKVLGSYTH
ncbi:dihydroorotate dehydrogenase-like protein [Haloferula sp.]|uniref:dihydroorotate dehydrogenase-like protein n=1 Tax=Haloferula sp. TaxID=2497595 RepID=UPI003C76B1EE